MNELDKAAYANDYEWALDMAPKEVRDFLWSDAYKGLIDGIAKTCVLTDAQKETVSSVLFDLVINASNETDAKKRMTDAGIIEDKQGTIFSLGYDYFISLSEELVDEALQNPEPEDGEELQSALTGQITGPIGITPATPSALLTPNALATIQQRLQSPNTTSAATTRDYSIKPSIDPYKEPIDNK